MVSDHWDRISHAHPRSNITAKDFRENIINKVIDTIEDEDFIHECRSKKYRDYFTRKRKLPFSHLLTFLLSANSGSLQRELDKFYKEINNRPLPQRAITKGALTHARKKLNPKAFLKLNKIAIDGFYKEAPYLTWNGFRLLAADGSVIKLPDHPSVITKFKRTNFGPDADSPQSLARINLLYDVLNQTVVNGEINDYYTDERIQVRNHFKMITPNSDILILDRGYISKRLLFEMQQRGINFCMRMKDSWLKIRDMIDTGVKDRIVRFKLLEKDYDLLKTYKTTNDEIVVRIVVVPLPNGEKEVLCCSVLSNEVIQYEKFVELYHARWSIEESYKILKSRMNLEAFTGKTIHAVYQDFYAKVFIMTATAVLAFPVEEEIKKAQKKGDRKHLYKINRTTAVATTKKIIGNLFINKRIRDSLEALDKNLKENVEPVRFNRKNPRNKVRKKPFAMAYKQL